MRSRSTLSARAAACRGGRGWCGCPPTGGTRRRRSAARSPAGRSPRAAARRLTSNTLRDWGLAILAEDAETIIGEFVANAVTHAAALGQ